jgi:hypothetical protein
MLHQFTQHALAYAPGACVDRGNEVRKNAAKVGHGIKGVSSIDGAGAMIAPFAL